MAKINYADKAFITITQTVADTIEFAELPIATVQEVKHALIIHRIEYDLTEASWALLVATPDYIKLALTTTNALTSIGSNQPEVVDKQIISYNAQGWMGYPNNPIRSNFTDLPGGGLIIPAKKIYGCIDSGSLGTAVTARITFLYTMLQMSKDDYYQLLESYNILQ